MRDKILDQINNPHELERLYRGNKSTFKREFNALYPEIGGNETARVWYERLNYEDDEISWGTRNELTFVVFASLMAGLVAKIPAMTGIEEENFFSRNISFIVFPFLAAYFSWKQKLDMKKILPIGGAFFIALLYINLLPSNELRSHTFTLAAIHLPLFLWAILGYAFLGDGLKDYQKRLDYLRYNGDLVVMGTLILISGMLLTGVSIGLFSLIKVHIEKIFVEYVVVWGLAAAPIVATYLVQTNPQLVNKVSPVIAKVFTPLVLITLVIYLISIIYTGQDPYNDRDFLIIFNIMLIGVMAIILFSIIETDEDVESRFPHIMLTALSGVTILVNGIALSAILFRIAEWGITPNRMAVLGGNLLMLSNLCIVAYYLFKGLRGNEGMEAVKKSITSFLPYYSFWTIVVTFLFPLLFGFK